MRVQIRCDYLKLEIRRKISICFNVLILYSHSEIKYAMLYKIFVSHFQIVKSLYTRVKPFKSYASWLKISVEIVEARAPFIFNRFWLCKVLVGLIIGKRMVWFMCRMDPGFYGQTVPKKCCNILVLFFFLDEKYYTKWHINSTLWHKKVRKSLYSLTNLRSNIGAFWKHQASKY